MISKILEKINDDKTRVFFHTLDLTQSMLNSHKGSKPLYVKSKRYYITNNLENQISYSINELLNEFKFVRGSFGHFVNIKVETKNKNILKVKDYKIDSMNKSIRNSSYKLVDAKKATKSKNLKKVKHKVLQFDRTDFLSIEKENIKINDKYNNLIIKYGVGFDLKQKKSNHDALRFDYETYLDCEIENIDIDNRYNNLDLRTQYGGGFDLSEHINKDKTSLEKLTKKQLIDLLLKQQKKS